MSNVIGTITYTFDIPSALVESIVGRRDDHTNEWYEEACEAVEKWVENDELSAIEYAGIPDVEVN